MATKKKHGMTIDIRPTWLASVRVYCAVLQNPRAGEKAIRAATEDLERLARIVDGIIAKEGR